MVSNIRYRVAGIGGVIVLVSFAFLTANYPDVQVLATTAVPMLERLQPHVLTDVNALVAGSVCVGVFVFALTPLYKPRPRRILDTLGSATRRSLTAVFALATLGYFDYSYRLPRITLIIMGGILLVTIPMWFFAIRPQQDSGSGSAIVVGDDSQEIRAIFQYSNIPVLGLVSPPSEYLMEPGEQLTTADGGDRSNIPHLGNLTNLHDVLSSHNIETAFFAFAEPNREAFFSALSTCHKNGVNVKIHRKHIDSVLTTSTLREDFVDVELEPWDWQERVVKRVFDILFAVSGLLFSLPLVVIIAILVKLDSSGPILYSQERTSEFGNTFTVYKFRTMNTCAESVTPGNIDNRVTDIGRFLRRTHLDEIPQLWSILVGDMSVVGPRPAWIDEEEVLEKEARHWRQRWFVRPGLTGLAQINGISSKEPIEKLRYDLLYIQNQNFWYDLKIVIRQIWLLFQNE
jgi:lipopolysaccharide/colanic/teichoic acid biosynthesis glycosyltransferase